MPKRLSTAKAAVDKPVSSPASSKPVDGTEFTTNNNSESGGRTAGAIGKSAGQRIATATRLAGKKIRKAAVLVSDLNKDGKVDQEDAGIATTTAKRITSKAA